MLHWCCKSPAYFVSLSTYPWHRAVAFQNYYWYLPWPLHDNIICIELQNSEAITLLSIQPSFTSFGYAKKIFQLISVVSIYTEVLVSRLKLSLHWYCCVHSKGPNSTVPARLCAPGGRLCGAQVSRLAPEVTFGGREVINFAWDGENCFQHTRNDPNNPCWIYENHF